MNSRSLLAVGCLALAALATVPAYDRVFETSAWRGPVLLAALIVLSLAVAVRALRRGPVLSAVVSGAAAVAVWPWLLGLSPRPVLPAPSVVASLRELSEVALVQLAETPSPAPALPGLVLIIVASWWVVLFVAHELTVRLERPGAALITLATLWAVPLAIQPTEAVELLIVVPFLVAGILLLKVTARAVDDAKGAPGRGAGVAALAVVAAVMAPTVVPAFEADAWFDLGSSASPRGYQPIVDVSQRLGMPDERDVLRVRSSQRSYLRLAGLDGFDGSTWRLGPGDEGTYRPDPDALYSAGGLLPPEQSATRTQPVLMDVEVLELENIYVPTPYQPVEVLGPIRDEMVWSTEGGFLATWETVDVLGDGEPTIGIREGVEYRVQAARPAPTFEELSEVEFDEATLATHTRLPRDYPELGEQARAVYDQAGATTPVAQALALQDWFVGDAGGFTYDLDVPALRGEQALTDFVLEDRVGYCEYFATAMAVMLRETGIPARVAVGFLPGRVTQEADPAAGIELTEYTVSTADAHAWVEVLFPGYGWITFEPTPRDDDSHILPSESNLAPIENVEEQRAREAEEATENGETPDLPDTGGPELDEGLLPDADTDTGEVGGDAVGGEGGAAPWIIALLVLVGVVAGWQLRRRRTVGPDADTPADERVRMAQRQLLATAASHGIGRQPQETTAEVLARWAAEERIDAPGNTLVTVTQAAAFGGPVDDEDGRRAARELDRMSASLRASVSRGARTVAPVRTPFERTREAVRRGRVRTSELLSGRRR
jgi:MYXO-CTERM domain-containing protein